MAEECIASTINESTLSESSEFANDDSEIILLNSDPSPYDNTPLVSLHNSASDLNVISTTNVITVTTLVSAKAAVAATILAKTDDNDEDILSSSNSLSPSPTSSGSPVPLLQQQMLTDTPSNEKIVNAGVGDCGVGGGHITTKEFEEQKDHEKVDIYLETPVVDEKNIMHVTAKTKHILEKTSAKPKRLSDEFIVATNQTATDGGHCCIGSDEEQEQDTNNADDDDDDDDDDIDDNVSNEIGEGEDNGMNKMGLIYAKSKTTETRKTSGNSSLHINEYRKNVIANCSNIKSSKACSNNNNHNRIISDIGDGGVGDHAYEMLDNKNKQSLKSELIFCAAEIDDNDTSNDNSVPEQPLVNNNHNDHQNHVTDELEGDDNDDVEQELDDDEMSSFGNGLPVAEINEHDENCPYSVANQLKLANNRNTSPAFLSKIVTKTITTDGNSGTNKNINCNSNHHNNRNKKINRCRKTSHGNNVDDEISDDCIMMEPVEEVDEVEGIFDENNVQSMDAIERRDFKQEQKLTGGVIVRNSSLISSDNRLKLGLLNNFVQKSNKDATDQNKKPVQQNNSLSTTPTSSRSSIIRATKTSAKINLAACLESVAHHSNNTENRLHVNSNRSFNNKCNNSCGNVTNVITGGNGESSKSVLRRQPQFDATLNSNSNDSLSSDKSYASIPSYFSSTSTNVGIRDKQKPQQSDINNFDGPSSSKGIMALENGNKESSNFGNLLNNKENIDTESYLNKLALYSVAASSSSSKDAKCTITSTATSTSSSNGLVGGASSSSTSPNCQYGNNCCGDDNSLTAIRKRQKNHNNDDDCDIAYLDNDEPQQQRNQQQQQVMNKKSSFSNLLNDEINISGSMNIKQQNSFEIVDLPSSSSSSRRSSRNTNTGRSLEDPILEPTQMSMPTEPDNEYDDDTWVDCEEGSDTEEVCTCRDYTDEEINPSSEDELPSRDVDLSSYTGDIFHDTNPCTVVQVETPRIRRKRKISELHYVDGAFIDTICSGRKRLVLENKISPKTLLSSVSTSISSSSSSSTATQLTVVTSPSSSSSSSSSSSTVSMSLVVEKRTPRSIIPTKDNPPPELNDWLLQFQRWSQPERLLALDRLIDLCEPTQVRHMMKVIEPQFQRDFISLLPKELALQVLSYLEPKDLLRAAQTCRNWRFLCDDNLLWKEKCKQANILIEPNTDRPKRGRAGNMPPISSTWKAAYMRQHIIEMNWRSRPIRQPKILKGHDDHVITCLQFCGNRIVSGSDDNTLKVWSAITGKCLRTLVGHTGGVWSSQMSSNIIISGSTDRTLKVWNADSGQCIHTLYGHTSTVRCMHLHGNKVVSGSRDATLRVWDVTQGTCLHVLVGHLAAVRCVQYDGKLVVSGAYDYMVKVWNPERQECLHTLQGHTNRVYSLQFDGIHVVSGSLDTSIRVWDAETGSCRHTLMGHQSLTSGMELRQNILVSGNADSTVKVWDILTGQCLQTLSGPNKHQSAVTCLQFNSRFVITSSDDGTVKLWDVKTGEFIRNLVALESGGSGGVVWRIRANDTKLICAVGSRNGTEETKLMVLDFDVEGACLKCS